MWINDIVRAVSHDTVQNTVDYAPGEKLHERMIGSEETLYTHEYENYLKF